MRLKSVRQGDTHDLADWRAAFWPLHRGEALMEVALGAVPLLVRDTKRRARLAPAAACDWSPVAAVRETQGRSDDTKRAGCLKLVRARTIRSTPPDGVAPAAIRGLYEVVREKDARITKLENELAELKRAVQSLVRGNKEN